MTPFKKIFLLMLIILYPQVGLGFDFTPLSGEDVNRFKMKITVPLHEINSSEDSVSTSSSSTSASKEKTVSFYIFFEPYGATLTNILPTPFPISIGSLLDSFLNEQGLSVFLSDLSLPDFLNRYRDGVRASLLFGHMREEILDPQSGKVVSTTEYRSAICLDAFTEDFLHKSQVLRNMVLGQVCQNNTGLMQCLIDVFNFKKDQQATTVTLHNFRQLCTLLAYALGGEGLKERKDGKGFTAFVRGENVTFKDSLSAELLAKRMRNYLTRTLELTFDQEYQTLRLGAPDS